MSGLNKYWNYLKNHSFVRFLIFFFFKKINLFNRFIFLNLLNKNSLIFVGKVSEAYKCNEEYVSNPVKMDVLIQGPILGIAELNCCLSWVDLCKKNRVQCIISTWDNFYALILKILVGKRAVIQIKKKPEKPGPQNINNQIAGVMNGLAHVRNKHVLKVRTDHYPTSIYCLQVISAYFKVNCEIIVGPSSAEREDELRDQYIYTTKKILQELYGKSFIFKQEQINEICKKKYESVSKNYSVENYIFDRVRTGITNKIAIVPIEPLGIGWAKYPGEFAYDASDMNIKKQIRQKIY